MTQRRFERSIYLNIVVAIAIASSSSQGEILHWFRLEEDNAYVDVVGDAMLGGASARGQEFVTLPNDVDGPGASFPSAFFDGAVPNRQAIQSQSNANTLYADGTTTVSDAYTIEFFTNVENYDGVQLGSVLASQATDGFDASRFSWMIMLRIDGLFGSDYGELVAWSSDGQQFEFHQSGFVLEEGVDYYVAGQLDAEEREYTFHIKDLTNDSPLQSKTVRQTIGPLNRSTRFRTGGVSPYSLNGLIDEFRFSDHVLSLDELLINQLSTTLDGDFNIDYQFTVEDLDLLAAATRNPELDSRYDLTEDGQVNADDIFHWIDEIKNTWVGDSNFDGQFDSGDLVAVFGAGQYEDGIGGNSTWTTGDWNGDAEFDSGDLVFAFAHGGYEAGEKAVVAAVPEPASFVLIVIGLFALTPCRRKTSR